MSNPSTVLTFVGNASYSNRGCEAIVRSTTDLLRDTFGECSFISNYFQEPGCKDSITETDNDIIHRPFSAIKKYTPLWVEELIRRRIFGQPRNLSSIKKVLASSIKSSIAFLLLGGDTFSLDYFRPDHQFEIVKVIYQNRKPLILWGASVGPFSKDPEYEKLAVKELKKISLICARETETLNYLDMLGLQDNLVLTADPAFNLRPQNAKLSEQTQQAIEEGCIGLNLSPLIAKNIFGSYSSTNHSNWIYQAAELVKGLITKTQKPILLIPHVVSLRGDVYRDDYLFLRDVKQNLQNLDGLYLLEPDYNAGELKDIIQKMEVFIGARTHSTIAALSSCVPTICVGYSMKARGIAQDIYGNLDWLIRAEDLKVSGALIEKVQSLLNQKGQTKAHLEQIIPAVKEKSRFAAVFAKNLIEHWE